ncbi:MAG TPA: hypothetical protein VFR96_03710 [Povalibacter sp.]|jgi:hypothetical protein|nr:hypothetical protein [Povalibacter sp.]
MKASSVRCSAFALLVLALCGLSSTATAACTNTQLCSQTSTFIATVTDFRTSISRTQRIASAVVHLQNRSDRPLTLAYVSGSGVVIDDQGNRYGVDDFRNGNAVRAIGIIKRNTFDPKFTLQPGESGDARFEFNWYPGQSIVGTVFQMELTIREIDALAGGQQKLGREHALQFQQLTDKLGGTPPAPAAASTPASSASGAIAGGSDPCAGNNRCRSAGPFVAEISQITTSTVRNQHLVRIGLKLRNVSDQQLILGYVANSGVMVDNYGNRYAVDWRSASNVQGIGQVSRGKADPQFVLNPGEARSAVLQYSRYIGKTAIGTVFAPDLAIQQLEILPSQQIREVREYSLSFADVTAGGSVASVDDAARQLSDGLKSLFRKKN